MPEKPGAPFVQQIRLMENGKKIGMAGWHCGGGADGVAQLLYLTIDDEVNRQGHAGRLLRAAVEQVQVYHRTRQTPLRRMWIGMEQKAQVKGRAFLTGQGFHHVATVSNLHRDQDLLIYARSFD